MIIDMQLNIRKAIAQDSELIHRFICDLAEFEKLSHLVSSSSEQIRDALFGSNPAAEVLIAEYNGISVGFALYFFNYSTFLGKRGLYLEDLFVQPEFRGLGIGKSLLSEVAKIAIESDCGRMEWSVLDWNPARKFYEHLGASALEEWLVYRIKDDNLRKLANN